MEANLYLQAGLKAETYLLPARTRSEAAGTPGLGSHCMSYVRRPMPQSFETKFMGMPWISAARFLSCAIGSTTHLEFGHNTFYLGHSGSTPGMRRELW
jgi:hypothetical protein